MGNPGPIGNFALRLPDLPEALSDRQQDVSEPLLAVADLAGSDWGKVGRTALTELFGGTAAKDDSLSVRLLSDIRVAFAKDMTGWVQESEAEAVFKGLVTPVTVQAPVQATHAEKVVVTGEL